MVNIPIKTKEELAIMEEGGQKLAAIIDTLAFHAEPGVTTWDLEMIARDMIRQSGGESSFKGFHGYPAVSCISINEEVVHGIPSKRKLKEGDIVGIDVGLRYKGFCTDSATTVAVGKVKPEVRNLLDVTHEALFRGIEAIAPAKHLSDVSHAIQQYIEEYRLGIVRDLTGHGIGKSPHEEPSIPNFGKPGTGPVLKEGMTLAIEPMVTAGKPAVKQLDDGWTIATLDGSLAAHFEHTVAVTENGFLILTQ